MILQLNYLVFMKNHLFQHQNNIGTVLIVESQKKNNKMIKIGYLVKANYRPKSLMGLFTSYPINIF